MFCNKNLVSVEKEKKIQSLFYFVKLLAVKRGVGALDFDFAAVIRYLRELISVG